MRLRFLLSSLLASAITFAVTAGHADDLPTLHDGAVSAAADAGIIFMASHNGFDRKNGLAIEMDTFKGDPVMLKALIAGQLDVYEGGPGSPMIAASKGADVRIIGCHWPKQNFSLWAQASIKTLADLRGKAIGISAPGSAPDMFIRAALSASKIPTSEVRFVSIGTPPDLLRSLGAGVIDAGGLNNELDGRAASMGLKRITTSDDVSPLAIRRCFNTTASVLKKHPDTIAHFLAAEMEAYAYALSHRHEALNLTREITRMPATAQEPEASFDDVMKRQTVSLDFSVPMDRLFYLKNTLVESGQINANFDPASIVDNTALTEARRIVAASH